MASVKLEHVTKIFDKNVIAAKDVNIEIADKEFMVLVGPSGCGKSTTLRMIAGLEDITSGNIYIGDRLVNHVPPKDRDIAMVFQNYALYPHMTVYENMAFGLKLRKYPKKEIDQRVNEAAEILEIKDLLNRKPKALSGGQRQRVAVGRAIVRKPKVFLFDEPLSNLDAKLRVQMRTEISKLHNRLETTMIYVTHDQMEAMTMGDRIVVMKDGMVQQIDTPLNLYHRPINKFVAGFIGSPSMNFMTGVIRNQNGLIFDEGRLQLSIPTKFQPKLQPYEGRSIIFGIRPENISLPGFAPNSATTVKATSLLEVVEPMGNEIFLYFHSGKHQFVARVTATETPAVGKEIEIIFNMENAHFFDPDTEQHL
ncbi:MAG: sn-glycerol-3-phosphate ABC transporter ATP-binding protein UgpC [candidate division KSB1 bacterium]|nr:sn-glycerol-3-phosphate ABC transporter ATP-binding protein UgpC [candidate division KSB1 bacterium]MDZ7334486.1 sn-glycerol-3-phosphate ABC transporter ATP-binding protein UgpC [candidate division KSB1 bacterium]MDZ7356013.1 sn-glycerol-3-phosphate ABC transporter ATP-binding protein UgpC [candidate division KSB1 bacterium]MDZ7377124.1 sn-glycerol-3-phosphate ABC transporter ATP-binding protein UgpC [candidate division KSB1 bacterium]MDZ7400653.1 sn-glycerol-3-phosphate ABC transporter ATP-